MNANASSTTFSNPLYEAEIERRIDKVLQTLREYSVVSVIEIAMSVLNVRSRNQLEDLGTLPSVTLLLVQLACRNKTASHILGPSMPGTVFDALRKELWDLAGSASLKGPSRQASFRSVLPSQIEFQVSRPGSIIRWALLLKQGEEGDPTRLMFEEVIGMTPEQYIDAATLLSKFANVPHRLLRQSDLEDFPDPIKITVARLLKLLSRDPLALRAELQAGMGDNSYKWELFQIPFAAKYPFLKIGNGDLFIWHPRMLARALEGLIHQQLMQARGSEYLKHFTRKFEDYVIELCQEIYPAQITEQAWQAKMGQRGSAVEAILPHEGANVFVEAKMAYNRDVTVLEEEPAKLVTRLERLTDGLYQARRVSQRLRKEPHKYPNRAAAAEEFAIIVTSRELYVGHGKRLEELLPAGTIDFDDAGVNHRLPLKNVHIVSIDDFELLQAGVKDGKIELLAFLREVTTRNSDPSTAEFFLSDHLQRKLGGQRIYPTCLNDELNAADDRVLALLKRHLSQLKK